MAILLGLDKLESKLSDIALTVQRKTLIKATKRGGELIRAEAQARAPRRTGRLAENEIMVLRTSENTATDVGVRIGPAIGVFYGLFEEIGTAHSTADPFLRPAFDDKKAEALQIASEEFDAAIDEVVRKG